MIARYAILFFLLMALVILPLVLALLFRFTLPRKLWRRAALVCTVIVWGLTGYGFLIGFQQLEVHQIEYASANLPKAFDGYRIVQFSDVHVASMTGPYKSMVQRAIDSINAQHADAIVFTGDMENVWPDELASETSCFRQLKAKDGVFAVLGNHDYAVYQNCDEAEKIKNCQKTIKYLKEMDFDILLNEHRIIKRDSDSIIIAGMENWGTVKRMPRKGDVAKTLKDLNSEPFIIMLQHDPTCWREKILPECKAQLTLSGHTHGGQISLFGWSPVAMRYSEWRGMTYEGLRAIYVSTGLGALIPFRIGLPGEIVVITLKKK